MVVITLRCPPTSLPKINLSSHAPNIVNGPINGPCGSAYLAPCVCLHHPARLPPTSPTFSFLPREVSPRAVGTSSPQRGGRTKEPARVVRPGPRPQPCSPAGHCPFNRLPLPGALRLGSKFLPVIRSRGEEEEEEFVNVQFVQRDRCLLASPRPVLCVCESVCACACLCVCVCGGCECVCV